MNPSSVAPKARRAATKFFDGSARGILSGHVDRYNGIRIDTEKIEAGTTPEMFREEL